MHSVRAGVTRNCRYRRHRLNNMGNAIITGSQGLLKPDRLVSAGSRQPQDGFVALPQLMELIPASPFIEQQAFALPHRGNHFVVVISPCVGMPYLMGGFHIESPPHELQGLYGILFSDPSTCPLDENIHIDRDVFRSSRIQRISGIQRLDGLHLQSALPQNLPLRAETLGFRGTIAPGRLRRCVQHISQRGLQLLHQRDRILRARHLRLRNQSPARIRHTRQDLDFFFRGPAPEVQLHQTQGWQ